MKFLHARSAFALSAMIVELVRGDAHRVDSPGVATYCGQMGPYLMVELRLTLFKVRGRPRRRPRTSRLETVGMESILLTVR